MKLALGILTISMFIYGCSGGGRGRVGAPFCQPDHKPFEFEVSDATRTDLTDDKSTLDLKEGNYELTGLEVYVNDKEKGIRVHISADVKEGEIDDTSIDCIGTDSTNAIVDNMPFNYTVDGITDLVVPIGSNKTAQINIDELIVSFNDNRPEGQARLQLDLKGDKQSNNKGLKKTYEKFTDKTQYLYSFSSSYEMRNSLKDGDASIVQLRQIWKLAN